MGGGHFLSILLLFRYFVVSKRGGGGDASTSLRELPQSLSDNSIINKK